MSTTRGLTAYVEGVGVLGPGLADWPAVVSVLRGANHYEPQPTVVPAPAVLPPAERRRTGTIVKLALAVGLEATSRSGADAARLPTVFSSSGGDGQNCHEICQTLASDDRQLSPTRFHNSVHNAAAGYWGIATSSTPASNALCGYDASFTVGLMEALTQLVVENTPVLLIAYDASYPEPLRASRPIPDAFGVALVLSPAQGPRSLARLQASFTDERVQIMQHAGLESLRASIPAARCLPLLRLLARGTTGKSVLEYLDPQRVAVEVTPCA